MSDLTWARAAPHGRGPSRPPQPSPTHARSSTPGVTAPGPGACSLTPGQPGGTILPTFRRARHSLAGVSPKKTFTASLDRRGGTSCWNYRTRTRRD